VLTYHSARIDGNNYGTNDHVALKHDLRAIQERGFRIVPLAWVVEWVLGRREGEGLGRAIALSFDDGADFDYYDIVHPRYGPQRSFYNLLRDFRAEFGKSAQPHLHAAAFVIASPRARRAISAGSYAGRQWMHDNWWAEAERSGLLSIYSHSWDHDHPAAARVCEKDGRKGSFAAIDEFAECECEIARASAFIHRKISPAWPRLFAYPWGEASPYLRDDYLPSLAVRHRTLAAFGSSGGYVTKASPRWNLPRFVFGAPPPQGWRTPEELERILVGAA